MNKVLNVAVIGAKGQLGTDIVKHFSQGECYQVTSLTRADIDITNVDMVRKVLTSQPFDVVINSAAYVRVDDCEQEVGTALDVNAIGALNVARACRDINAMCVYISTDYVFNGDRPTAQPYCESDIPKPINVYGTSKLTGEYLVQQTTTRSLIVRIASVFGKAGASGKGGNFVQTMLKKARAGEPIKVVNDIFMSPTYTHDAARLIDALLQTDVTGIIHGANSGSCSWYEFASKVLQLAKIDHPITPIPAISFLTKATRPRNSALVSESLDQIFKMPAWEDALATYLSEA